MLHAEKTEGAWGRDYKECSLPQPILPHPYDTELSYRHNMAPWTRFYILLLAH